MRRPLAALVLAALVLVLLPATAPAATTATATTTTATSAVTVTRRDLTFTDTARGRTLRVMTLKPETPGRKPLIVFVHGVTASGPAYESFLRPWAEAGYMVAAPTEPLTSGPNGWANIGDYKNQPADVRFVIGSMITSFPNVVDPTKVAVAGHSLGAITAIGMLNSCCVDSRVDAIIELSGIELPFANGDYLALPSVPLLLVHGAKDTTVGVSGSDNLFAKAKAPAHYLRLTNAGHVDLLASPLLQRTVLSFLSRYLKGNTTALNGVAADVAATGGATWQQKTR